MYYPYMHGLQAELQALAACADDFGTPQQIFPVIEPVRPATKLKKELAALKTAGAAVYLVINPLHGDLGTSAQVNAWTSAMATEIADTLLIRPVLHERPTTTASDITTFIATHSGRKMGIILNTGKVAPADVATAIGSEDVIVFLRDGVSAASYSPAISAGKIVEIRASFNVLARNSDYSGIEWFSGDHINYVSAGQAGFSDYTVLSDKFVSGGGPVGATAFHLTYEDPTTHHFWVQHFVSDETDRALGTVSTKLLEAITHLHTQMGATPGRFSKSPALASYLALLASGRGTNLAKNKQLQIEHHLYTVARLLGL